MSLFQTESKFEINITPTKERKESLFAFIVYLYCYYLISVYQRESKRSSLSLFYPGARNSVWPNRDVK